MSLTGGTLPVVLLIVGIAAFVALVLGWPHARSVWRQRLTRAVTAVLLNLTVLAFAAVQLNNQYSFYVSWSDLLGATSASTTAQHGATAAQAANAKAKGIGLRELHSNQLLHELKGRLLNYTIIGTRTQHVGKVVVYLPAGYNPLSPRTYPVLLALHGYPGTPASIVHALSFMTYVDRAVAAHQLAPSIVVVPQIDTPVDLDSECVNVPGGHQVETWLAQDVPSWVVQHFRVNTSRLDWATWGFSYGGWCASMLAMRHPDVFGAAVAMQGYFHPDFSTDYVPFGPKSALYQSYDLVRLARRNPPPVSLFIVSSKQDSLSYPSTAALIKHARYPLSITAVLLKTGGHRFSVWQPRVPQSLAWLGRTLPGFTPAPLASGRLHATAPGTTSGQTLPAPRN